MTPSLRESFKKKDATDSPVEMAAQFRPSRSILKQLLVKPVAPSEIEELVVREHYLHNMPATASATFAVYWKNKLAGAAVFTAGPRNGYSILSASKPQDVATLARFYLLDVLPKNSESRVLGVILRHLRKTRQWKFLLSYADPSAGHIGTIYQATSWMYLGMTKPNAYITLGNNKLYHPRTVYGMIGTNSVKHLQELGIPSTRRYLPEKHRYGYPLDSAWKWRIRILPQSFPKRVTGHG